MSKTSQFYYPFSAVIGQDELKTALLLAACDPLLGGVLMSGCRGSAKSTLARSLADLLHQKPFINCPLGVSEDRLLGSLDVERVLAKGELRFSAGLFAQADGGVLYVDEVNLLPDHLVDLLLDVSASGVNYLERDGISHQHSARFILIGSMNPEEGALRAQLLDRFGLSVQIDHQPDLQQRLDIVASRLAFDHDPAAFCQQYQQQQDALRLLLQQASENLENIEVSQQNKHDIAKHCLQAGVEGVRADLALYRASRAYAALHAKKMVSNEDIEAVLDLVLHHRRPASEPSTPSPSAKNKPSTKDQQATNQAGSSQSKNIDPKQQSQGDWGEMPVEEVKIGLKRQLEPNKFSQNNFFATQKKKQ